MQCHLPAYPSTSVHTDASGSLIRTSFRVPADKQGSLTARPTPRLEYEVADAGEWSHHTISEVPLNRPDLTHDFPAHPPRDNYLSAPRRVGVIVVPPPRAPSLYSCSVAQRTEESFNRRRNKQLSVDITAPDLSTRTSTSIKTLLLAPS